MWRIEMLGVRCGCREGEGDVEDCGEFEDDVVGSVVGVVMTCMLVCVRDVI